MVDFDATPFDSYWKSIGAEEQNKILTVTKETIEYDIANISLESFSAHYSSKDWFGRKFYVILGVPSALISALCYLFAAMLDDKHKEMAKFSFRRSLQIALGHLITVIDDLKGQYYVQKGLFHIACYMKSNRNQTETESDLITDSKV